MANEKPEIKIKKLKVNESLSEETLCYSATINVDGVDAIAAGNRGTGGASEYHPLYSPKGSDDKAHERFRTAMKKIEDYAATLPPDMTYGRPLNYDAEMLIDTLVERENQRKKLARRLRVRIMFAEGENPQPGECEIFELKPNRTPIRDEATAERLAEKAREMMAKEGKTIQVLNTMPIEKAMDLFAGLGPDDERRAEPDESEDSPAP